MVEEAFTTPERGGPWIAAEWRAARLAKIYWNHLWHAGEWVAEAA